MLLAVPEADKAIEKLYGEGCFEPDSEVYGHFWRLVETRGYVRLLLDIVFYASDAGEYETAVTYAKRVLQMNHGDNNGALPLPRRTPSAKLTPPPRHP